MKRILVLSTGGTFGMEFSARGPLSPPDLSAAELSERLRLRVPELQSLARCEIEVLMNRDSAHLVPEDWGLIARRVRQAFRTHDGVVILHGTDTLPFTASALSFLLSPCRVPVILTGAQRPLSALRTDARRNLISAVEIAAQGGHPRLNQVCVFFDDRLLQGNRCRKRSASEFDAFESPQSPPLAVVGTQIRYGGDLPVRTQRRSVLRDQFNEQVVMLHLFPGFPARSVREGLLPKVEALVLVAYASGTAPTQDPEFLRLLRVAREAGKPLIVTTEGYSRAPSEAPLGLAAYAAGAPLVSEGCLWAGEMTPECAVVKTMLGLGQGLRGVNFERFFLKDFAGEGASGRSKVSASNTGRKRTKARKGRD